VTRVLPRKDVSEIEQTMFIRPRNPDDHRQFHEILPWMTPLFIYHGRGLDWVRWSVPQNLARKLGMGGGCACCGKDTRKTGDVEDFHVDTAWIETDWWLEANGYRKPEDVAFRNTLTPREGEEK
jgi:hypothetical protein